ncbi:Uncharacterised protein [Mycobacteroides abscessus subsp. abscessus]|nr:Uncharacterised protein [Mycobacteroides abscessus subsp. abscessus]
MPVRGPNSDMGAVSIRPISRPVTLDETACQKVRPMTIGSQPKMIVEKARFPPTKTANRFFGEDPLAASGR